MEGHDPRFFARMRLLGIVTFVAFAMSALAVGFSIKQAQTSTAQTNRTIRIIICDIKRQIDAGGVTYTRRQADVFYNYLVTHDLHGEPCHT